MPPVLHGGKCSLKSEQCKTEVGCFCVLFFASCNLRVLPWNATLGAQCNLAKEELVPFAGGKEPRSQPEAEQHPLPAWLPGSISLGDREASCVCQQREAASRWLEHLRGGRFCSFGGGLAEKPAASMVSPLFGGRGGALKMGREKCRVILAGGSNCGDRKEGRAPRKKRCL